jgi:NAD(P)-dependent dehydrogenase (short-subunit alcohol dehydrogenase family)
MLKDGGGSLLFTGATMSLRKCNGSGASLCPLPNSSRLVHVSTPASRGHPRRHASVHTHCPAPLLIRCSHIGGGANFSISAPTAFARRGLSQSLAREFGPKGIHVAHVIVDGIIETERIKGMMGEAKGEATVSDYISLRQVLRC